ncbi:tetratricopeptide repeat protein [Thermomonospora umbrina]|uniref:Tetratricopeptide repeat protein n=1 Tax=Thermomonospora umbrina TaxID=111806 RepID=A0A3D9SR27_9ACTN|nr:tetratricopeptide repeat protein [Thermomonospora umbrina]REE98258.1 tetratricopeptide repeat protein [Thermomonospora umbrina]
MSVDDVYELMQRAGDLPYGEARTVLVEDALRRSEAAGDEELAFRVRMELTGAYQYGGEPAKAFTTFSRCLTQHDRDPGTFGQGERLLWHFKWVVNSLTLFPEIPLDRTYAVLDDMERRYRLGGHSLHAVYCYRHAVARHLGDFEEADRWYGRWHTAPRDQLSDCEGCDPSAKAYYQSERGRHEEAVAIAAPVLNAEINCTEQPQSILTNLLTSYLHSGRLDEAGRAHRRAYRLVRPNIRDLSDIAEHVRFCALTGNEARGLEILERHLGWLDRAPSPYSAMAFAAAGALLLRRLTEGGFADGLTLRRPSGEVTVDRLREELSAQASGLAERFDARNGTSRQGDLVRGTLAAEPVVEHLPLTPYARRPAAAPSPVPVPEPVREARDPDALLDAADEAWRRREGATALAAWARFDEVTPEPTTAQAGRRHDGLGFEALAAGDSERALTFWRRAAELHAEAGDEARAQNALSRTGAVLCDMGRTDEGFELLETSLARLAESSPGSRRERTAGLRLATALTRAGRPQEALELFTEPVGEPMDVAEVESARGLALLGLGDAPEAATAFRRACENARVADAGPVLAEAAFMLAQLLMDAPPTEGPDEALDLLNEAMARTPTDQTHLRATVHAVRGKRMLTLGRDADAVEDLIEAVAAFTAVGAVPQMAHTRLDLAFALLGAERHLEAAEVAEEAGPMFERLDDAFNERRSRYVLAEAQRLMGEEGAADTFAELARDEADPGTSAQLMEKAGDVLTGLDKDAAAAERFAAAAELFGTAGDAYGVVRARRRAAMCLAWSGRLDDGLREMDGVREALGALPADNPAAVTWETSVTSYDQARLLASAGRIEEAVARTEEAVEGFTSLDEQGPAEAAAKLRESLLDR